jgi:type IV pilus assembly protein PilA
MTCPYCAEPIPDGSQFCPKCGTKMGTPVAAAPSPGASIAPPFPGVPATSGKAIGSLICGVFFFFLPTSIAAVVLGHLSLSEIRKSAGRLKGQGLATAGLILGYMGIAFIPFILIIAAIAIPNLLRARMAANEASAVGTLRTYNVAIASYAAQCAQKGYPISAEQLGPGSDDCDHAGLVDGFLASQRPMKSGYVFEYHVGATDAEGRVVSYVISADPVRQNQTGIRHFYSDETQVIRFELSTPAGPGSPPL